MLRSLTAAVTAALTLAALSIASPAATAAPRPATAGQEGAVSVSAPAARLTAAVSPATYTIRAGDTLYGIAARFCGRGSAYPALAAGNGIRNPDLIFAGATIRITCTAGAPARTVATVTSTSDARAAAVVRYVLAQVGKPYVWGAAGPYAFDCSGLVMAAYARVGVRLPHYTETQMNYGRYVPRSQLRPGDVVMPYHGHVVIYVGSGRIVEAANPQNGVELVPLYAYLTARRYV